MGTLDPRIDAYIAKAPEYARPILDWVREAVHKGCPDVTETMKWSAPFFVRKKILCNMVAFKNHCSVNFWKGSLIIPKSEQPEGMGQFGKITNVKDLPSQKVFIGYIKEAARIDEAGIKLPSKPRKPKPAAAAPDDLLALLRKSKKAAVNFENFSPGKRREYIDWITEAKRDETRQQRLAQTIAWVVEGKSRHWKYQRC
jgi:uncharacterized protein YdeI (YjbR/CyaY-like superfamily)